METLPRITRRTAHKLLKEKTLPNRLQRFCNGGFKRKAEFLTLTRNKRSRKIPTNQNVCASSDVKDISPSSDPKFAEENVQMNNGQPVISDSIDSARNNEAQTVVELPAPKELLANILNIIAELENSDRREGDGVDFEGLSVDGGHRAVKDSDNDLGCEVNRENDNVPREFQIFNLKLEFDTDSEDQTSWNLADNELSDAKEAGGVEQNVKEENEDVVTSKPTKPLEDSDSVQCEAVKVFDKISESDMTDAQSCNDGNPLLRAVKEHGHVSDLLGLESSGSPLEKQSTCKAEQLKELCRLGPGSQWLYSGSRFAAFLRSAVGVIDRDAQQHLSQTNGGASAKARPDSIGGRHSVATSPKHQLARFPGKRKVALSPSSQLKLLEASKSSSYRRMMPFCNELAKDLAKASATQSTTKMPRTRDCIDSKEYDMYSDKGLSRETLSVEYVKSKENVKDSMFVTCGQGLSQEPISRTHIELEQNGSQKELPPGDEEMSRDPQCIGHDKVEEREFEIKLTRSDEEMCMLPQSIGHINPEENGSQTELTCSDEEMKPSCTGHDRLEQNAGQMELPSTDKEKSREPSCVGHDSFDQGESQMNLICSIEEFSREPLTTKHVKLKDNVSQPEASISDGPNSAALSIKPVKFEEIGVQLESFPSDQYLSRKSLFVEHVKPDQNGSPPESAICDHSLRRESIPTECDKPKQTGCQLESASIQSKPSPACHPYDPSDNIGKNVASWSSSTKLLNGQCVSTLPMQKSPTSKPDNMSLVDYKTAPQSLSSSVDRSFFSTAHGEVPSPLHTPASVRSKGILKISPRSCKGICMCSDCVSFRLQAERASDFSERQLQEMEALAMTLMNELANVRNIMAKYLIAKPKGAWISYPVPHSELKEASRSALRAEETARSQLVKMTRVCNLHCKMLRIQRRRVKFADKVEVKMFNSE